MGADKQRRYAKKVAKKANAREGRLERAMNAESWVERPREAPAVRLKLDAAADRGRRVARLEGAVSPRPERRRPHPPRRRARRDHGRQRRRQDHAAPAPARHAAAARGRRRGRDHGAAAAADASTPPARCCPGSARHARRGIDESEARTLLAHFGLDADAIRRPLERLSPGQRARAAIAALVGSEADLLLLDEPTNHLDFDTLEVLETALAASPSTIVAVSHDRWFLDAIGTTRHLHVADGNLYEGSSTSSRE